MSDAESLPDKDSFVQLRQNLSLIPPQPPSLSNNIIHLNFPFMYSQPVRPSDSLVHPTDVIRVTLRLDASPGCGGIAWPAGQVLSRYIARRPHIVADKTVIELGSGTGLVGLVAASIGAKHVWVTDQFPLLDIMRANVTLNGLSEMVDVIEYNWGSPKPDALACRAEVILAADCVYFEPAFPLLVATLCDLIPIADSDTKALFCYKKRRKADKRFFNLLKKHFEWKQVDDDPDFPVYSREAISLLRLTRKR